MSAPMGPVGANPDDRATTRRKGQPDVNRHKTVTFGDGAAIVGSRKWSVISVLVLMVIWYLFKIRVWGDGDNGRVLLGVSEWNCDLELDSCEAEGWLNDRQLASQGQVVSGLKGLIVDGYRNVALWANVWASIQRVTLGLALGIIVGVPVGLAMGLSNVARAVFDPIVELFRPVPPLAFIPLVIIWFGIGEGGKVVILFFAALWIMIISSRSGVLGVKLSKVHAAYSLGASKAQIARYVIIPNALPDILTGVRVSLGVCWGTLVAAEILGASKGLGAMIWAAQKFIQIDIVIVGIGIIAIIGVALDLGMRSLEARLIPWRGKG